MAYSLYLIRDPAPDPKADGVESIMSDAYIAPPSAAVLSQPAEGHARPFGVGVKKGGSAMKLFGEAQADGDPEGAGDGIVSPVEPTEPTGASAAAGKGSKPKKSVRVAGISFGETVVVDEPPPPVVGTIEVFFVCHFIDAIEYLYVTASTFLR